MPPHDSITDSLGSAALKYAKRGWPVLPLHGLSDGGCTCGRPHGKGQGECAHPGKHPRTQHGMKDATCDTATVEAWWQRWPDANIGIRTGRKPDGCGMWVLDIDVGTRAIEFLDGQTSANGDDASMHTLCVRSGGGGMHFYYLYGPELGSWLTENRLSLPSRNGIAPPGMAAIKGFDVRGDGGYIIAPPSLHESGRRYEWERA